MLQPGVHRDIPIEEYNAHPAIRSSHLKILLDEMPADLKYALDNMDAQNQNLSPALLRGLVLHTMVLEPELQEQRYVFETEDLGDKRSGEAKKAWDALKKTAADFGRQVVPYEIYRDCKGMADALHKNPDWENPGKYADKELTLIADINGVRCKVRLDARLFGKSIGGVVYDLKTTSDGLSDHEIQRTIAKFSYHFSAAMYLEVGRELGMQLDEFVWVFLQSKAPYQHRFVRATPEMLKRGRLEFLKCLEIYRMSAQSEVWTGHNPKVSAIDLPDWYFKRQYAFGELKEAEEIEIV